MKKDAYYFSHDSNARHDEKILAMRSVYKGEGYGWYWIVIELMRDASDYRLTCNDKYWHFALCQELQIQPQLALRFINDCIHEFHLFKTDGNFIWSESLLRRMAYKDVAAERARQKANKRWAGKRKAYKEASATPTINNRHFVTRLLNDESKPVRESIEKIIRAKLTPQVLEEFTDHLNTTYRQHAQITEFINHFCNWHKKRPKARITDLVKKKII